MKALDNLNKEMNLLLNNFWITKDEDPENYYLLKRRQKELQEFIFKNLGSKLIIHERFIKLEKISSTPSKDQGIETFTSPMDYVFLFIFLLYLEDKPRGEKFILSQLIDYVKNTAITLELSNTPDWTYASHRKSLIRVIKYLVSLNVIIVKDEDKISFQDDQNADALYEVTGISNYLTPSFDHGIFGLKTPKDFLNIQWEGQDTGSSNIRRYNIYRNLLYRPATYRDNISEGEYDYLKKLHKTIENEISEKLDFSVEITKNMALIYTDESLVQKDYFPNTKRITDIILLINKEITDYIKNQNIEMQEDETYILTKAELKTVILDTKTKYKPYYSKAYLDLTEKRYLNEIITNMENYHLIKENQDETYKIYPLIYRFIGDPVKIKENKNEQIEIFGGEEDEL